MSAGIFFATLFVSKRKISNISLKKLINLATMNLLCRIFGHPWMVKSYSKLMNNDSKRPYSKKRICLQCGKTEYKYAKWVDERMVWEGHKKLEEI